jgi:hypothetical protein
MSSSVSVHSKHTESFGDFSGASVGHHKPSGVKDDRFGPRRFSVFAGNNWT